MERAARTYRPLPGRAAGLAWYHRLWLGPDHLLAVRSFGFTEEYKRFYFRDIQAILIGRTDSWKRWNLIWCVASTLVVLVSLMATRGVVQGLWLGLGGLFFGLFLVNLLGGPTCVCQVRTAVQTERLPTLKRLRTARKIIARLKPMIEQTQGSLAPAQSGPKPPGVFVADPNESPGPSATEANQPPPTTSTP